MVTQLKDFTNFASFDSKNNTEVHEISSNRFCNDNLRYCMTNNNRLTCDTYRDSSAQLLEIQFGQQQTKLQMR